jgi:EAL domain-containing protein (putative c-di-GMP-specific phosphodiesterase class I)/tetratricopeptide (TPR) repeat protein
LSVRALILGLGLSLALASVPAVVHAQPDVQTYEMLVEASRQAMMRDPQQALDQARAAEDRIVSDVAAAGRDEARATLLWLQAEALTRLGRPVDAEPVAREALEALGEAPAATKLYADILVAVARIEKLTGAYGLSLEHFQMAYTVFREIGEPRSESIVLQSIASIYKDAHQYDRAVDYYIDATERFGGDPTLELAARNNLGNAYREMGEYDLAEDNFRRAYDLAVEMESPILQSRILSNIASLDVRMGLWDAADASLDQAFALIDPTQTEWARFLWGVRAQAAHGRGNYEAAQVAIGHTFDGLSLRETTQPFIEFHEAAARIYEASGDFMRAVPHLRAFKRLDDEARTVAASANNALLGAQFDFAEQELQIEQLRTESLEQALTLADTRARQRLQIVFGLLVLAALSIVGGGFYYRALRQRHEALRKALYADVETGLATRFAAVKRVEDLDEKGMEPVVLALGIERYQHLETALGFDRMAEVKRGIAAMLGEDPEVDMVVVLSRGAMGLVLTAPADRDLCEVADGIRARLSKPVRVEGLDLDVAVTVGAPSAASGYRCLREAVRAVEQARAAHLPYAEFDDRKQQDQSDSLTLMSRMISAISDGHMQMHYQPKLHLPSGTFAAAEALVRWNDPERGFIPPDRFIGLAEETGRIREFTEWSLDRVVMDRRRLLAGGHDIQLSVNISGALISDPEFARIALDRVASAGGKIGFEITETAAMNDPERALRTLNIWREAGIELSIDDYGAGLSSLAYLRTLPAQELKLDRAFVSNIASSQRDRMLVKSTSELAHALGLQMTAEGVEDEAGLALLKVLGCDWAQGYLLSRALPLDALRHFLDTHARPREIERPAPGNLRSS